MIGVHKNTQCSITSIHKIPVSNLLYLLKIIEKSGIEQLVDHLSTLNQHSSLNSGYKQFYSTEILLFNTFAS